MFFIVIIFVFVVVVVVVMFVGIVIFVFVIVIVIVVFMVVFVIVVIFVFVVVIMVLAIVVVEIVVFVIIMFFVRFCFFYYNCVVVQVRFVKCFDCVYSLFVIWYFYKVKVLGFIGKVIINDFGGVYFFVSFKSSVQIVIVCIKIKFSNKNIYYKKVEKVIRKRLKMKIRVYYFCILGVYMV